MLLVLVLLSTGFLKEKALGESADFMLKNMTFFFIPPGVGIIRYSALIQSVWWQLILVNLISLVICFGASSWTVVLVMKIQRHLLRRSA